MKKEKLADLKNRLEHNRGQIRKWNNIKGGKMKVALGKYVLQEDTQYDKGGKYFILEEVDFLENNKTSYRIGYWIIGEKESKRGQWIWGQFCPLITDRDLEKLIKKAKENGIL